MRYLPEEPNRKIKTTRVSRLIIQRRKDDTLRKIQVVECKDTGWYPTLDTYDDITQKPRKIDHEICR
jgi:hypothetical protein